MYNISNKLNSKHSKYEIACSLSHLKCILEAYNNNDNYCIIMEDDISFELMSKWKYIISSIINKFPNNWEIINLCMTNSLVLKKIFDNDINLQRLFIKWTHNHYGAVCYIINRKGIKKLVDKFNLLIKDIGYIDIEGHFVKQKKKNHFLFDTKIKIQDQKLLYSRLTIPKKKRINKIDLNIKSLFDFNTNELIVKEFRNVNNFSDEFIFDLNIP